jgi:hypothetical protein
VLRFQCHLSSQEAYICTEGDIRLKLCAITDGSRVASGTEPVTEDEMKQRCTVMSGVGENPRSEVETATTVLLKDRSVELPSQELVC